MGIYSDINNYINMYYVQLFYVFKNSFFFGVFSITFLT